MFNGKIMNNWKLRAITDSYRETKEFRFNNYIINPHVKNIIGNVRDKTLLEIGCGFGRYLEIFYADNPLKLVGCDISPYQVELCKENIKNSNIELHVLDFSDVESSAILGQHEYDIVYSIFVILYIDALSKLEIFIKNCYECLKQGGKVVICTLDIISAYSYPEVFDILKFPTKFLKDEYTDGCPIEISITNDCVVTCYHMDFDTIKRLMEKLGFKNVRKHNLFLKENALQSFTEQEFNLIKESNILLLIEAEK